MYIERNTRKEKPTVLFDLLGMRKREGSAVYLVLIKGKPRRDGGCGACNERVKTKQQPTLFFRLCEGLRECN